MRTVLTFFLMLSLSAALRAQELQAKVTIVANRIGDQAGRKAMQTLQGALTNFINNRKWTNDVYQTQEKITCNFLLTIDQDMGQNVYKSTLTVQAARPF